MSHAERQRHLMNAFFDCACELGSLTLMWISVT